MPLTVTFELSDDDLQHLRQLMRRAREAATSLSTQEIIDAGRGLLERARSAGPAPAFVTQRLEKLAIMIDMLEDEAWQLPPLERTRVMNALAYFCEPAGLIPDDSPVLGLIDDAIMIELIVGELHEEIDDYTAFCRFRREAQAHGDDQQTGEPVTREMWLRAVRKEPAQAPKRKWGLGRLLSRFSQN